MADGDGHLKSRMATQPDVEPKPSIASSGPLKVCGRPRELSSQPALLTLPDHRNIPYIPGQIQGEHGRGRWGAQRLNLQDPKTAVGSLLARGLCVASVYLASGGLLAQTEPNNVRRARVKGVGRAWCGKGKSRGRPGVFVKRSNSTGRSDDVPKKNKAAMMDSLGSSGPDRSGVAAPSKRETEGNRREGHSRKKCKCDPPGGRSGLGVVCRWGMEGWRAGATMRGDEAGIPSCEETRQQQKGHSGTRAFKGRRERGTVGRNYFYFARQPARPRHDHTNEWRVPEALLAMVKGGWREWRPPVGECLARSPGPWSNVPRACCSTGDAARSREWPGRPCALLERDAQPTGPRCGHWIDGRTDRTVDDAGRWTRNGIITLLGCRPAVCSVCLCWPGCPSLPFSGSLGTGRRRPEQLLNFANIGLDRRDHRALGTGLRGRPLAVTPSLGTTARACLDRHIPHSAHLSRFLISICPLLHSAARLDACFEPRRRAES